MDRATHRVQSTDSATEMRRQHLLTVGAVAADNEVVRLNNGDQNRLAEDEAAGRELRRFAGCE